MSLTSRDSIYKQRKALALILRDPIEQITSSIIPMWKHRESIENLFLISFSRFPYCDSLYALDTNGVQITESIGRNGIQPGHLGRDHSQLPHMHETVPAWGFLLSDAYLSVHQHRPTITALQLVRSNDSVLGYIAADFDLRDLPLTSNLYPEPGEWQQQNGNPSVHNLAFKQPRDEKVWETLEQTLSVLGEMLVTRGVFQCHIHFASNTFTIWTLEDPYRFQILDRKALTSNSTLREYPHEAYPYNAIIPQSSIGPILDKMRWLHCNRQDVFLHQAFINIFNNQISLNFSEDVIHTLPFSELLTKDEDDWFGNSSETNTPASF